MNSQCITVHSETSGWNGVHTSEGEAESYGYTPEELQIQPQVNSISYWNLTIKQRGDQCYYHLQK